MDFEILSRSVLADVARCVQAVDAHQVRVLVDAIASKRRLFLIATGRSGAMLDAMAVRLGHLDVAAHVVGQPDCPDIKAGDLVLVGSGSGRTRVPLERAIAARRAGASITLITTALASHAPQPLRGVSAHHLRLRLPDASGQARDFDGRDAGAALGGGVVFKGNKMAEWFEKFFNGLYGYVEPNVFDDARTAEQARMVNRLIGVRKGQRVLDVPCGSGRLLIPMARTGVAMTGVDFVARSLRRARRHARREGLDVRLVCRDMRNITFRGEFDAAVNWGGSFGYFSDADNAAFCERVLRALKPGGRFLIDGINKSWVETHFRPRSEHTFGAVRLVQERGWDERTGRAVATWTFTKGRKVERHRLSMRLYNGTEMRSLLHTAGFREIKCFGYPPLGRFSRHSRRLIAVARRPR